MTLENGQNGVETPEGAGTVAPAVATPETVAPGEGTPNVPDRTPENVQKNNADISKMQEQIDNLNAALRQERESGKTLSKELQEKLQRSEETISKLKNVFAPEQPKEEPVQEYLTVSQVEELLERREAEKKAESHKKTQAEMIQAEIKEMENEWNGAEGKPKYDDKEVIKWQEENGKLYLSPREAFNLMQRDAIIDWEIKNRMTKKPEIQSVERPGAQPAVREPNPTTPVNTTDLRAAVLEAMENAVADNSI